MGLVDRLNSGVDRLASKFSSMQEGGGQFGDLIQDQPGGGGFGGMVGGGQGSAFGNLVSGGGGSRFGSLIDGAQRPSWLSGIGQGARSMIDLDWLEGPGGLNSIRAQKAAAKGPVSQGQPLTGNTGAITGIDPAVAQWADQANKTFGDLGPDMPDVMLAIMTNESGGKPTAYNAAGNAYGLFQQVGLNSWDPNVQFSSAKQLAQQKLASIAQSYAANGLNPDQRTRARDIALAWAGHFDYATGRPNPSSRDVGSGQTADQLSAIFLTNYDKIKAGRQQAATPGAGVTPSGYSFPVVGFKGPVQLHHGAEAGASDLFAPEGTSVVAMRGGRVIDAGWNSLGGNTVTIVGDDGLTYYYAHLRDAPLVRAGQQIAAGGGLGFVGQTGNAQGTGAHLHLGIGKTIISGAGALGGSGTPWGNDQYSNAVGLLTWVLGGGQPTGGGGTAYR